MRHRELGSGASPALLLPEEEYPGGGRWWELAQPHGTSHRRVTGPKDGEMHSFPHSLHPKV